MAALEQGRADPRGPKTFEGVDHAFFNDTGPRYDEAAATEAYALLLDWFGQRPA